MSKTVFCAFASAAMLLTFASTASANQQQFSSWQLRTGKPAAHPSVVTYHDAGHDSGLGNAASCAAPSSSHNLIAQSDVVASIPARLSKPIAVKPEKLSSSTARREDAQVVVVRRRLSELVKAAGARSNLDVKVTRGVRAMVRDAVLPADLEKMLPVLSENHNITWYRMNRTVFISSTAESASRVIFLGYVGESQFRTALAEAGIDATNMQIEYLSHAKSISLTGPVSFLAQSELIAEALVKTHNSFSVQIIKGGSKTKSEN